MKNKTVLLFCLFLLCTLMLAGTANAAKEGYVHTCYSLGNAVTVDGQWSGNEWQDGYPTWFGTNAVFRTKWEFSTGVYLYLLMESMDNTNDVDDYWQICFDGDMSGGTAPQAGDYRIDIKGHGTTANATWYQGSGTTWTQMATPGASVWEWKAAISATPTNSTPHAVFEMKLYKNTSELGGSQIIGPQFWMRVAQNDAHTGGFGLQAWPPTNRDVPNDYGDVPYSSEVLPEDLNIIFMIALSSVAIIAGSVLLRKRSTHKLTIKPI